MWVSEWVSERINMYEHKSAQKMIGPLSYIYYNNANASRIYKIYHFLVVLLSFVCMCACVCVSSFALFAPSSIIFCFWNQISTWHTTYTHTCSHEKRRTKKMYRAFGCRRKRKRIVYNRLILCSSIACASVSIELDNSDRIDNSIAVHSLLLCVYFTGLRAYFFNLHVFALTFPSLLFCRPTRSRLLA